MTLDFVALWVIPILLGAFALVTITFILRQRRVLLRGLSDVDGFLARVRQGDDRDALARSALEHVVPVASSAGVILLTRPLAEIRREFADDEMNHHWPFWVGSLFTGFALIATFLLIAAVMVWDVSGAINESASTSQRTIDFWPLPFWHPSDTASTHLSTAVENLGGKFLISAVGIAGSVVAMIVATWARNTVYRAADHPGVRLVQAFSSVDAEQIRAREQELALWREDHAIRDRQHGELRGLLAQIDARMVHLQSIESGITKLDTRMARLQSIEVSIKDMATEVSANLKHVMKEAMGEQLTCYGAGLMMGIAAA